MSFIFKLNLIYVLLQRTVCLWQPASCLYVTVCHFFFCVHHFFTFQKTGLLRPTPLVREAWKNCWNWANTVKDMMCDISHLSHHQQQQQKTTSNEPMVWYWYLWSQEEQGWMIQKPTFVFGNAWKISLALSSWLEFLAKTDRMINCVLVLPWSASTIWLWCLSFTSVFGGVMGNISEFSKKSLGICKLPTLRLETGLNSPTFKVRHKFAGNLSTHI